jgi:hypothetical protein
MLERKSFKKENILRIFDKSWKIIYNDLSQCNKNNYKLNIIKNNNK